MKGLENGRNHSFILLIQDLMMHLCHTLKRKLIQPQKSESNSNSINLLRSTINKATCIKLLKKLQLVPVKRILKFINMQNSRLINLYSVQFLSLKNLICVSKSQQYCYSFHCSYNSNHTQILLYRIFAHLKMWIA